MLDSRGYHQFQPLLYQIATAELAPRDIRFDLTDMFARHPNVEVRTAQAVTVDPGTPSVTLADTSTVDADVLVLGVGAQPNFFRTPGAQEFALPLYSLDDAERVRTRLLELYRDAAAEPALVDDGGLTFVIVGAGPTGVETAGAVAELVHDVMPHRYPHLATAGARVILVDLGHTVLPAFSEDAHAYATTQLRRRGVELRLGVSVKEVTADHVTLGDGTTIGTRLVVWGGGEMAAPLAFRSGLPQGAGGRIDVRPDLTVPGFPAVYGLGDVANIPTGDGNALPQLGSVAQQAGDQHRRRYRGHRPAAVPVQGQGNHGDDRPQGGLRRDRSAPPRAQRAVRVRRLARRPRGGCDGGTAGHQPEVVKNAQLALWRAIGEADPAHCVRGQYDGYRDISGVAGESTTETYAALRLEIDNWRWSGVPFFIRAGKRMPTTQTEFRLIFRRPPRLGLRLPGFHRPEPDELAIKLDPFTGIRFRLMAHRSDAPGPEAITMDMGFAAEGGEGPTPYEVLLHAAMARNSTRFQRQDGVEETWRITQPLIAAPPPVEPYPPGTWGPVRSEALMAGYGGWRTPW